MKRALLGVFFFILWQLTNHRGQRSQKQAGNLYRRKQEAKWSLHLTAPAFRVPTVCPGVEATTITWGADGCHLLWHLLQAENQWCKMVLATHTSPLNSWFSATCGHLRELDTYSSFEVPLQLDECPQEETEYLKHQEANLCPLSVVLS